MATLRTIAAALCLLAAVSCDNPREQFSLVQDLTPADLQMGLSFDLPMEENMSYSTTVACRVDAAGAVKENVELVFNVISPDHASYSETVSFPLVSNVRQQAALGPGAEVRFKKRGAWLDNQWGWRSGISCDSLPGRWLVIISTKDPIDLERIKAIGFSYKGQRNSYEQE